MKLIADETVFFESPSPSDTFCYTPYLSCCDNGRLLAGFDLGGPGVPCGSTCIFSSDDGGKSWRERARLPLHHSRTFQAGTRLYCLGHDGYLGISVSADGGDHWGGVVRLDETGNWHQSGCTIDRRDGRITLVMERAEATERYDWPNVCIILMSASEEADLTRRESWSFSEPFSFSAIASLPQPFGMPFLPWGAASGRFNGSPCFLETNVLRIVDPDHMLYDPEQRTVQLLARLHAGSLTNMAVLLRGREEPGGCWTIDHFTTPGGAPYVFVPLPGGQMKFQIIYDPDSRLYWMVSTQAVDSMTRVDRLGPGRYGLPDNERRRLALHFSKNLTDWCFAGLVAAGGGEKESRHYASLLAVGGDLLVLSRSGDRRASTAHDGNLITLHRVRNFRDLAY